MAEQLEAALAQLGGGASFEFGALLKLLPGLDSDAAERLRTRLMNDERFFYRNAGGEFVRKSEFFRGRHFVLTPTDAEIEDGILFFGHRFCVYCDPEVFPSEVTLQTGEGGQIAGRKYTGRLDRLFGYYLLLGSEQIFDCLIAEHPDNIKLRSQAGPNESVIVTVADMAAFYRKHGFASGDALLCEVLDYEKGRFRVGFLPGEKRGSHAAAAWCRAFENGLGEVVDEFKDYLEIPEQLKWAYFRSELPEDGEQSMDEFVRGTEKFELDCSGEYTVLARRKTDDEGDFDALAEELEHDSAGAGGAKHHSHGHVHDGECCCDDAGGEHGDEAMDVVPDGFGISKGETSDVQSMLTEAGSPLTPVEIDSYILDMAYARELDFDAFYARVFGRDELNFADEAQETVFLNYVEDRYEQLTGNYQRYEDERKAPLRQLLLELVDQKLEDGGEALPKGAGRIFDRVDRMLAVINRINCDMDDAAAEAMEEEIGKMREKLTPPEL